MSTGPATTSVTALLLLAACAAPTQYLVNTTSDFPDANAGDNVCAGRSNLCSLRAAIEETNAHPAGKPVLIGVPAGTYDLNGQLTLTHDRVTISGNDPDTTIISQSQLGQRVLKISTSGDIWIGRVTLRDGSTGDSGGAIRIDGNGSHSLTLNECRILDNRAGFLGGGVYAQGANGGLNIFSCVIQGNDSTGNGCTSGGGQSGGGGIMVNGPRLTLFRTEVRDNCGSNGGGVRIQGGVDHLILQSTIAGNGSATRAGGLYIYSGAQGRIEDSTIAQNQGPEAGGVLISEGKFVIKSATIVGNTSLGTSNGPTGAGGILSADNANVSLKNTVIADNNGVPIDCGGPFASSGGNFVGTNDADCDIAANATDVLGGGDPSLGSLGPNGGPTRSMMPYGGSPLVDGGVPGCGPTDQRDISAPFGGGCDIGAVERH